MLKQKCPNCNQVLDIEIKRKRKCPLCGQYISVRNGKLLTDQDKKIEYWLERLTKYKITKKEYDKERRALRKQFGSDPSVNDVLWRLLNIVASKDKRAYLDMKSLALDEERDPTPYLEEFHKRELMETKQMGITHVDVYTRNDDIVCDVCKELTKKFIPIDEAIRELPIPRKCKGDFCRCWYISSVNFP